MVLDLSVDQSVLPHCRQNGFVSCSPSILHCPVPMSTTTKQYTTSRPSWREREIQKERQRREEAARAVDEAQRKKISKTEENFPTTIQPSNHMTIMPIGKFAELATKWQIDDEIMYRHAKNDHERTVIRNTVLFLRSRGSAERPRYNDEEEEEEPWPVFHQTLEQQFPSHGRRGYSTPPDGDGWRLVTKKPRKQKTRALTEAELAQKYRDAYFEGDDDVQDVNGDLADRNQRRDFY